MPITIKTGAMKYKKPNGEYDGFNAIAQESTDQQIASIQTAGAAQVNAVQTTGAAQVSAVQQKGAETLDSIPDDYTELAGDVSSLKSAFEVIDNGKNTAHLNWEHGTISQTDGTDVDPASTTRARTIGFLSTNCVINVDHSKVAWGSYLYYYNKQKLFQIRTEQIQSAEIKPNKNYPFFRIAILRRNSTTGDVDLTRATDDYSMVDSLEFAQNINGKIEKLQNSYESLYIGELENKHLTASGNVDDSYSNYRLSSKNIVALPKGSNRKLFVSISTDYLVSIRTGKSSTNLNTSLYWYADGDTITIPDDDNYYALSFCVNDGVGYASYITTEITPNDINKMNAKLLFVSRNNADDTEAEKVFNASRLSFNTNNTPNSMNIMPVIAHTSDCHGDYARVKNFFGFCDRVNVDVAAITGDMVSYKPSQGLGWFKELVNNAKSLPAVCVGNHDAFDNALDDAGVYSFVFSGITTKLGNDTGKTWYYKDISAKSLRIISINLYQYGGSTRNYTHFTNEQLAWLCSTLASTPQNYCVILLYHSPQVDVNNALDADYGKFFQTTRKYSNIYSGVTGSPINDIIDAFIERTTISKTYTQTGNPSTVSVSADFSTVHNSIEFIAHLTGHFHQDTVCYVPNTTEKQLMLNVVCTNALYGGSAYPYLCDISDLPRNKDDITQNSFNLYVIDRTAGVVKITRVGSNTTYNMAKRDYMEIPYK